MTNGQTRELIQFVDVPMDLLVGPTLEIVHYLQDAHARYRDVEIPKIEQQFLGLMKLYPDAITLKVIFNVFQKFQLEMQWHMKQEEQELYPMVLSGEYQKSREAISHEDQEPFLGEVIQLLRNARYSKNPFGRMLIRSLEQFEAELRIHAWVEEHLLLLK